MIEVQAQTKPARPALLPVVCAATLFGVVALAWWQVDESRRLGDEVAIRGTPLRVRVPRDWVAVQDSPGRFVLPGEMRDPRGVTTIERQIFFAHARLGTFVPPEQVVEQLNRNEAARATPPEASRIGALPALQVRRVVSVQHGRQLYQRETAMRVAVTPGGDVIRVEYTPLLELSLADLELLDDICASIRLADRLPPAPPDGLLQRAGVRFPVARDWQLFPPDFAEVAGVFVQASDQGIPRWVLAVHRTWLAEERAPTELLRDFADAHWRTAELVPQASSSRTRNEILQIQRPRGGASPVAGACLVTAAGGAACLVVAYADVERAAVAAQAALELAAALEFTPTEQVPDVESAARAGAQLVLGLPEAVQRIWQAGARQDQYRGERRGKRLSLLRSRQPRGSAPQGGFEGQDQLGSEESGAQQDFAWSIDGRGQGYSGKLTLRAARGAELILEERRARDEALLKRTLNQTRANSQLIRIGPRFVSPPVESVAESEVAGRSGGAWLIEVSPLRPLSTVSRLLRPLPPDAEGNRRVLIQDDFAPRGTISAYDSDGVLRYSQDALGYLERAEGP